MSLQSALSFIAAVREQPELAARIKALGTDVAVEKLTEIGHEEGFEFSVDELRKAHAHDWSLRWIRFGPRP